MALFALFLAAALPSPQVAFVRDGQLPVLNLATGTQTVAISHGATAPVGFSGDGTLVSAGGLVSGGASRPTTALAWAPGGATAAYQTTSGAVVVWRPGVSLRTVVPASWGATSLAWGPGGRLALGRSVCHVPCGVPKHQEVWIYGSGEPRRVAGPLTGVQRPIVRGFDARGRVLWWSDLEGSASIAADGLPLYANRTRLATTLPYPDYVAVCNGGLAVAAGGDRYAMDGKRILLNGRDLSRDRTRSWVEPACSGNTIVAAASKNAVPTRIGDEHRAIWQLRPTRTQLTHPPAGATDEAPHVLPDGSVLFVRAVHGHGTLIELSGGKLTRLANVGTTTNFYGHYDWARQVAVWP